MKVWRHIFFWLTYCSYFYIQSIAPQSLEEFSDAKTYSNAFVSLCCFMPVCILSVYASIYLIFPRFIENKKYGRAILSFVVLFAAGTLINYQCAKVYYYYSHVVMYASKGAIILGYLNTIWAMIISSIAICLKVTRKWFRQQKEIEHLSRQKARNEINLQKNRIHPGFLYSTLDSIYDDLRENRGSSSSMILILSNLLSYSLYESKTERVALRQELNAVTDLISLENMKCSNPISIKIDDDIIPDDILVPPMLILSLLHDGSVSAIDITQNNDELIIRIDQINQHSKIIRTEKIYREAYDVA